jgi:hypothetical protein
LKKTKNNAYTYTAGGGARRSSRWCPRARLRRLRRPGLANPRAVLSGETWADQHNAEKYRRSFVLKAASAKVALMKIWLCSTSRLQQAASGSVQFFVEQDNVSVNGKWVNVNS